jgi:type II secretory pathway pseudopilin PulG
MMFRKMASHNSSRATMRGRGERPGAVLLTVLVAMTVATMLAGVAMSYLLRQRDSLARQATRAQCRWLAEAALDRAAAQLARDAAYQGETWQLAADEHGLAAAAQARIEVSPAAGDGLQAVQVAVDYPFPVTRATQRVVGRLQVRPSRARPN